MDERPDYIVVIGTSAGGFAALSALISQLKEDMNAAFFVVMHLSNQGVGDYLIDRMQKTTSLPCKAARDHVDIKKGTIYFGQPDVHLIIKENKIILGKGPVENRWRPAIDVLFRSAAASFGSHTIGIVLTGLLDDGTSGMTAIKKCGGTCIVQDPEEAEFPDMPSSVLKCIEADYSIPLAMMGETIHKVIQENKAVSKIIPDELKKEVALFERDFGEKGQRTELEKPSFFICPECGEVLLKSKYDKSTQFTCPKDNSLLMNKPAREQYKTIETSIWVALNILEERKKLLTQLNAKNIKLGFKRTALDYQKKIDELEGHIDNLRKVLFSTE